MWFGRSAREDCPTVTGAEVGYQAVVAVGSELGSADVDFDDAAADDRTHAPIVAQSRRTCRW